MWMMQVGIFLSQLRHWLQLSQSLESYPANETLNKRDSDNPLNISDHIF